MDGFLLGINIFFGTIALLFALQLHRYICALFKNDTTQDKTDSCLANPLTSGDASAIYNESIDEEKIKCSIIVENISSENQKSIVLKRGCNTFGRSADDVDFTITDRKMSRKHFKIMVNIDGRAFVSDCNSTNGTWVNGTRLLNAPIELHNGEEITAGSSLFKFRVD